MIIGASATMGMVWLMIAQGITLMVHRPLKHDGHRQRDAQDDAQRKAQPAWPEA
jgi:hypothetical protein